MHTCLINDIRTYHIIAFSGLQCFESFRVQWSILVEYRTRNQEVAGSTHTQSTACNLEQVANLLHAQANSASYPQQNGK